MTPMKAIRAKCLDCCCGSSHEVKLCTAEACPLHPFRLGKNPNIKARQLTEEQRAAMAANIIKNLHSATRNSKKDIGGSSYTPNEHFGEIDEASTMFHSSETK